MRTLMHLAPHVNENNQILDLQKTCHYDIQCPVLQNEQVVIQMQLVQGVYIFFLMADVNGENCFGPRH